MEFPDSWRISIDLDRPIGSYEFQKPQPGRPLRLVLSRCEIAPAFQPQIVENRLIEDFRITGGDLGLVTLEFELKSSQVNVLHYQLRSPDAHIVVDLELRPGVVLEIPPAPLSAAPTALPTASPSPPLEEDPRESTLAPTPALPDIHSAPPTEPQEPEIEPPAEPDASFALPPALEPGLAEQMAQAAPTPDPEAAAEQEMARIRRAALEESINTDFFPYELLDKTFPGFEEMDAAYRRGRYVQAVEAGLQALSKTHTPEQLESHLYFLAENRYQEARKSAASRRDVLPGWDEALNYYSQARRQSPPGALLRKIGLFRISQIYLRLNRYNEAYDILKALVAEKELPFRREVLKQIGKLALSLNDIGIEPNDEYLNDAMDAYTTLAEIETDTELYPDILFHIGEVYYQRGDYEAAANYMIQAQRETQEQGMGRLPTSSAQLFPHFALAAHKSGKANILNPENRNDEALMGAAAGSRDPSVRLEFAQMLDADGQDHQALNHYFFVLRNADYKISPEELYQAELAMTRIALEDTIKNGAPIGNIPFPAYARPFETLAEMYERSFNVQHRIEILQEQAKHLIARGREIEAIQFILPHLRPGALPHEVALELQQVIWDVMPKVMTYYEEQGDYLMALQVYDAFREYLQEHPQRNEIIVSSARILASGGFREQALEVLNGLDDYLSLSPEMQREATLLRRKLRLDPDDPESVKRLAPELLEDQTIEGADRARILDMLGDAYDAEGRHSIAAPIYLRGIAIEGLPLEQRLEFFRSAAEAYEKARNYSKVVEVLYKGLVEWEEAGTPPGAPLEMIGDFLMTMGRNYDRLPEDSSYTITAYRNYLKYLPDGPQALEARYLLAKTLEKNGQPQAALAELDTLAQEAQREAFWRELATETAAQLRWEIDNPYLARGELAP